MDNPTELVNQLMIERRVQEAALVATLATMEEQVAEDGWDQPPWLYMLYRHLPPTDLADRLHQMGGGAQLMGVQPLGMLPVPDSSVLAQVIRGLAADLRRRSTLDEFSPALGPDMVAWVLVNEGWMASASDPAEVEKLKRRGAEHTIHEMAGSLEVRILTAVDRTLTRYQLFRPRDGEQQVFIEHRGMQDIDGTIAQVMLELMEATP